MSNRGIARAIGVYSRVVDAMAKELEASGSSALLLPTREPGRHNALTMEEEHLIVNRLMTASARGAAIGN